MVSMPEIDNPLSLPPLPAPPTEQGWYFVQWRATEWPRAVWLWEGGDMWGYSPSDDPEMLDMTAHDQGAAKEQFTWRRAP